MIRFPRRLALVTAVAVLVSALWFYCRRDSPYLELSVEDVRVLSQLRSSDGSASDALRKSEGRKAALHICVYPNPFSSRRDEFLGIEPLRPRFQPIEAGDVVRVRQRNDSPLPQSGDRVRVEGTIHIDIRQPETNVPATTIRIDADRIINNQELRPPGIEAGRHATWVWSGIGLLLVLLGVRGWRVWHAEVRRRRAHSGLCLSCGYDLRASAVHCPECGYSEDDSGSDHIATR